MKLYLSSTLCWAYPVQDVIRIAEVLDFDGVEVWAEQVWYHESSPETILKAADESNIELSLHAASWDVNICAFNEHIHTQGLMEIEKSLRLAKRIGAVNVTVHPGRHSLHNQWPEKHYALLLKNLSYLATKAEKLGLVLSIEQMEPIRKEMITNPESMNKLLDCLPDSVMTTFDIAHVPLEEKPESYYHRMNRINKIHLSDATGTNFHVALGTGELELEKIMAELNKTDLPVVIEGFENHRFLSLLQQNIFFLQKFNLLRRKELEYLSYE